MFLTCSEGTSQKRDIFLLTASAKGVSLLQTTYKNKKKLLKQSSNNPLNLFTKSGTSPKPLNSLTLACVGLVFCSPVDLGYKQNKNCVLREKKYKEKKLFIHLGH